MVIPRRPASLREELPRKPVLFYSLFQPLGMEQHPTRPHRLALLRTATLVPFPRLFAIAGR